MPYLEKPAFLSGGAGLVSSTCDYLRFCLMLLGGGALDGARILSPKTVELMRQDHLPPGHPAIEPYKFSYGYGVSVVRSLAEKQGIGSVGEFGWGGAAGTNAWIDPQEDMISMVMFQIRPTAVPMIDHKVKVALTQAIVG
jgi:CubicO group peptidase (beta-lactamase class C family)